MKSSTSVELLHRFSTESMTSFVIFWICMAVASDVSASFLIWSATTANPLPDSPALAASMEALRDSNAVSSAILNIALVSWSIWSTLLDSSIAFLSFCSVFCVISSAIRVALSASFLRMFALSLIPSIVFFPSTFFSFIFSICTAMLSDVVLKFSAVTAVCSILAASCSDIADIPATLSTRLLMTSSSCSTAPTISSPLSDTIPTVSFIDF